MVLERPKVADVVNLLMCLCASVIGLNGASIAIRTFSIHTENIDCVIETVHFSFGRFDNLFRQWRMCFFDTFRILSLPSKKRSRAMRDIRVIEGSSHLDPTTLAFICRKSAQSSPASVTFTIISLLSCRNSAKTRIQSIHSVDPIFWLLKSKSKHPR